MQASGHRPGETARLRSDLLTVGAEQCLHFYYLMNGSGVGSLKVGIGVMVIVLCGLWSGETGHLRSDLLTVGAPQCLHLYSTS